MINDFAGAILSGDEPVDTVDASIVEGELRVDHRPHGEITFVYVSLQRELEIMAAVGGALERLDQPGRDRVLAWARDKYLSWRPLVDDR